MTAVVWSKRPTVRSLLACCLCRVKVTCSQVFWEDEAWQPMPVIRTLSVVASVSDVRHCRVDEWRRKERNADNIMWNGSNTAATIVCVIWRRAKKGDYSALFAFVNRNMVRSVAVLRISYQISLKTVYGLYGGGFRQAIFDRSFRNYDGYVYVFELWLVLCVCRVWFVYFSYWSLSPLDSHRCQGCVDVLCGPAVRACVEFCA